MSKNIDIFFAVSKTYLINEVLYNSISEKKALISDSTEDSTGVYVIVFRLLSVKSNTLVYSYIHYNYLFTTILVLFLVSRNKMMTYNYKEPRNFLSIIDKSLLSEITDSKDNSDKSLALELSTTDNVGNMFSNINSNIYEKDHISRSLDIINKLTYVSTYDKISNLTKMAVNRDYMRFICNILDFLDD